MGWEETCFKGCGLKAMMSELTQIFVDSRLGKKRFVLRGGY